MALVHNNTNQLKKRHYDDIRKFEEIVRPKIRFGFRVVRDYPQGCGIMTANGRLKVDSNVDSRVDSKHKKVVPERPHGKLKLRDPKEEVDTQKSQVFVSEKEKSRRQEIKEAMEIFNDVYKELFLSNREKEKGEKIAHWRVPTEAVKVIKNRLKWVEVGKTLGPISGVEVGDTFRYRSQLQMIGVHCQPQSGIDYMDVRGKNVAISIVDANRYKNDRESSNVMKYCGQGGVKFLGNKEAVPVDQKLERGNLALKNSMDMKNEVRVVRKMNEVKGSYDVFVYDGLYVVNKCEQEKGDNGKMVFMFELKRVIRQPQLREMLNRKEGTNIN